MRATASDFATRSYHQGRSGQWTLCTATVRECPLGTVHLDPAAYEQLRSDVSEAELSQAPVRKGRGARPLVNSAGSLSEVIIAPIGYSSAACPKCDRYQPSGFRQRENEVICAYCGYYAGIYAFNIDLRADEAKYLDEAAVRNANWYHVTKFEDWPTRIQNGGYEKFADGIFVHMGSKEAAMDRMRDVRDEELEGDYWLHEMRLALKTEISPNTHADDDSWPTRGLETQWEPGFKGFSQNGVTRYINAYEAPGTISLVANANSLRYVTSMRIPRAT